MKKLITDFCRRNRPYLDSQFEEKLSDEEFESTLVEENWNPNGDPDDIDENQRDFCFDCYPFEDQLRAYVYVDVDGKPVKVVVQGE